MTFKVQLEEIKEAWETVEGFVEDMEDNEKPSAAEKKMVEKLSLLMGEAYEVIEKSRWAEESIA